ncbi:MAG: HAD family phosphatase [Deltaproteobacteria bacterium]|nr:HAD family phosphatase [Deltaproteobacteria bacterium]
MGATDSTDILSGIRLIIFDFDGVIVDSEPLHFAKFAEVLADEGESLTWDEYKEKYLAYNDRDCFSHVLRDRGKGFDDAFLDRLVARKAAAFDRDMKTDLRPVPGTAEFIKRAAPHYRLAIASGALRHEIQEILEWQGLREFFPVIVGAEDAPRGKPCPDPFLKAIELTNDLVARGEAVPTSLAPHASRLTPVLSGECLVIEDSPLGIQGANAAGMRTLALTTSYPRDCLDGADYTTDAISGVATPVASSHR